MKTKNQREEEIKKQRKEKNNNSDKSDKTESDKKTDDDKKSDNNDDKKSKDENNSKEDDELQKSIWKNKYQYKDESFNEWVERISGGNPKIAKLIRERKFLFAGRILANRGLYRDNIKVTYSNCYVLEPPEENLDTTNTDALHPCHLSTTGL